MRIEIQLLEVELFRFSDFHSQFSYFAFTKFPSWSIITARYCDRIFGGRNWLILNLQSSVTNRTRRSV
jgi:hypothetical protein